MTPTISARPFADQIAAALGPGFTVDQKNDGSGHVSEHVVIETPAGARIDIGPTCYGRPAHFHVSGDYPRGEKHENHVYSSDFPPSINISVSKTPVQIAADIRRRFLPSFEKVWEVVRKRAEASKAAEEEKQANYTQLAALLGQTTCRDDIRRGGREPTISLMENDMVSHGHIKIHYGGTVRFEFSTDMAGATVILEAIKGSPSASRPERLFR